jgi:hypothetical protein
MPPSEQILATGHGYRITRTDRVSFERPDPHGSTLGAWITLGVGALGGLVALALLAQSFGNPAKRGDLIGGTLVLGTIGVIAFFLGRRALRRALLIRTRLGPRLFVDTTALRNEQGDELAPRDQLKLRVRIDLTDGMGGFRWARILYLCWPAQRSSRALLLAVPIFKTYDKRELVQLQQTLAEALRAPV